jgi:hypothetical protein
MVDAGWRVSMPVSCRLLQDRWSDRVCVREREREDKKEGGREAKPAVRRALPAGSVLTTDKEALHCVQWKASTRTPRTSTTAV